MKHSLSLWLLLLCTAGAHAQLYKWVGPDGKINYTDAPPPANVKQVEKKAITGGPVYADLPFELQEPVKSHPVTFYSGSNCTPCDDARKLLNTRGIPFMEKTVNSNEDIVQLKKVGGEAQLPLLLVGRNKELGFQSYTWDAALTAAGYPASNKLPKNFRNPQAEPAVPPKPVEAKAEKPAENDAAPAPRPTAAEPPAATGNAPPGFRF